MNLDAKYWQEEYLSNVTVGGKRIKMFKFGMSPTIFGSEEEIHLDKHLFRKTKNYLITELNSFNTQEEFPMKTRNWIMDCCRENNVDQSQIQKFIDMSKPRYIESTNQMLLSKAMGSVRVYIDKMILIEKMINIEKTNDHVERMAALLNKENLTSIFLRENIFDSSVVGDIDFDLIIDEIFLKLIKAWRSGIPEKCCIALISKIKISIIISEFGILIYDPIYQDNITEILRKFYNLSKYSFGFLEISKFENYKRVLVKDIEDDQNLGILYGKIIESYLKTKHQYINIHKFRCLTIDSVKGEARITHCWKCHRHLNNEIHQECVSCNWIICPNCGACESNCPMGLPRISDITM